MSVNHFTLRRLRAFQLLSLTVLASHPKCNSVVNFSFIYSSRCTEMMQILTVILTSVSLVLTSSKPNTGWSDIGCNYVSSQIDLLVNVQGCNLNPGCSRGQADPYNVQCQPVVWNHTHLTRDNVCLLTETNTLSFCGFNIVHLETDSLSCHRHLITLHLSHNKIQKLHDGVFDGMTSLRQILLNNNLIHMIGNSVFPSSLKSLQVIDLSYNKLTNVEPWFFLLPELILINASNNHINELVNNIGVEISINQIKHSDNLTVDLEYNNIECMKPYDAYSYFGFQNTSNPPYSMVTFLISRRMCGLMFNGNPFVCDCRMFGWYEVIQRVTDMFEDKRDVIICSSPPALNGQYMIHLEKEQLICDLSNETCPLNCSCIYIPAKQIIEIDCTTSQLTSLPLSLPRYLDPSEIELSINLTGNKITKLQSTGYLHRTHVFDLRNNKIALIDNDLLECLQEIEQI